MKEKFKEILKKKLESEKISKQFSQASSLNKDK
jgi:hypothetical protein